ncbi:hypothetical protein ACTOJ1_001316 [Shigella flexneri]
MATRSNINVKVGNVYHVIYCHNDGYIEHNGKLLFENYNSQELAEKLVSGGDLSSLDKSSDKVEGHSFDNRVPGYCVYYKRDRGEENCEAIITEDICNDNAFSYVWNGSEWRVSSRYEDYNDISLEQVLREHNLI